MGMMTAQMSNARRRIALIPGDGIGQEVVPAAQRALQAAGFAAEYVLLDAGFATFQRTGNALPPETLAAARACDGALFGAVSSPSTHTPGYASPILTLRKELDLYANIRPARSAPVPGSQPDVDFVIVRENPECLYVKQERVEEEGARVVASRVITRRRLRGTSCAITRQRGRSRNTTVSARDQMTSRTLV